MTDAESNPNSTVMSSNDANIKADKSLKMSLTCKSLRTTFPSVKQMQTHELYSMLEGEDKNGNLVVLDVRPPEEFDVSHIKGSIRVEPSTKDLESVLEAIKTHQSDSSLSESTTVVAYCSLGFRSSDLITKLAQHCKTKVKNSEKTQSSSDQSAVPNMQMYNLEGSLFKWANENRPMVDSNDATTALCHPFNSIWGKFLRKDVRAVIS
ncbi:uncharacterized protein LOC142344059 [Convolutriloba macropyga]|uniref:uncharacterized protein LOC142344059 n=1 Tax=Convolutriloba macropyga TaxID=536237 RepID=UPI003F51C3AB